MRTLLLFTAYAAAAFAAEDPREIVRRSVQLAVRNLALVRDYAFLERAETRELDSGGRMKTHKILLYDVTPLEGSPYRRLVGRDDRPLTPDEERIEQKKLEDNIDQRRRETPAQRAERISDADKRREREREPLKEIPDAFDFRITGDTRVDGRDAWVIAATPRSGYRARTSIAKLFPKFRGTLWIDKSGYQWLRAEAELTDTISWGLFVARVAKGAHLDIRMTHIDDEVWLPQRIEAGASVRIALVKSFRLELLTSYSNYRKSQADSHLTPAVTR